MYEARLPPGTGNVHGTVDVRPKHVGMKISKGRPLSVPVPVVFHPMGAASCQPRLQVHSHRCPLSGRKMHTHWLHVYRCSQTRLKAYRCHRPGFRCKHAGAHRPGSRCTGARRLAGARRPGSRCNHAGTCRPVSRCKLAGAYHRPGAIRMGSGSVYTYPPPVAQPNPWAQDIQAKLAIRSAGPVPSPG